MTRKMAVLAVLAVATAGLARAQAIDPIETRQAGQDLLSGTSLAFARLSLPRVT